MGEFNLSTVFDTVARAVPDQEALVWRNKRFSYSDLNRRIDGLAHYLAQEGLGLRREREELRNHESGQDHLGIYLRNGNEYIEAMVASCRARLAPFNINYRYVEDELRYLMADAGPAVLVYHAEFAPQVAAIRDQIPGLRVLIQVLDDSGNSLLPGAVDYESVVRTEPPVAGMPTPSGDDLYIIYTGGTTGMPKGVLWRQHDVYVTSMGGTPFGETEAFDSYEAISRNALASPGATRMLMLLPFMHAAAQWSTFFVFTNGGTVVLPDNVVSLDAANILELAVAERVVAIPVVGDALALPLVEEIERAESAGTPYDLSGLVAINNGGAPLTPTMRQRILEILPHVVLMDSAGASESGTQLNSVAVKGDQGEAAVFAPLKDTAVVSDDLTRTLQPGEGGGWLGRCRHVPLGYLGDEEKTRKTFPLIDGIRWSVPGDRADVLSDGRIRLLGRDSITINSGGEKIFVEEVERAMRTHPSVRDVLVVGRPSKRWGNEVIAVVQLFDGVDATGDELLEACSQHLARYKVPKAVIFADAIQRSPSGKPDYKWASGQARASERINEGMPV